MASKSLKDKGKVCESCDKKFGWNKKLLEHLEKISECKEFYISKEIPLPVTKVKGTVSKEEQIDKQSEGISNNSNVEMKIEQEENVSVLEVYERFNEKEEEAGDSTIEPEPGALGETEESTKRKKYNLDFKISAISRLEKEGLENIKVIAMDLRLKVPVLKSWWEKREKILKVKSLSEKKAQLDRSKTSESLMVGGETTLEESCEQEGEKKRSRRRVCGECEGCLSEDCGSCKHCLDKPKFGGKNTIRQKCLKKKCLKLKEERKSKGKKGKVIRRKSPTSTPDLDLSSSSELTAENTSALSDISMDQNESSAEESLAVEMHDTLERGDKVVNDGSDELKNALGSIGADYSQSWSQEPSATTEEKNRDRPLSPQMAAALNLVARPSQFPVLSNNHPSIAEPQAIVTIERVDKKKKKTAVVSDQVDNITNILGQLRPVAPQWAWPGTGPGYNPPGGHYHGLQQTVSPGFPYQTVGSFSNNVTGGVQHSGPPGLGTDSREGWKETSQEYKSSAGSVNISVEQVEHLRSVSSKIITNEMSQAQAAQATGLSMEIISCWAASYQDVLQTHQTVLEKAVKYDALAAKYNKMRRALANLHQEFLCDTDQDNVD